MNNSTSFSLSVIDWKKILVGFEIAFAGAALTYLLPVFTGLSYAFTFNGIHMDLTPVVMLGFSVLSNVLRKFITDHSTQ